MNQTKQTKISYFDKPDGHDVFNKFRCFVVPTAQISTGIAIADVMLWSHPKGYLPTITRMVSVASPIVGASAVFVATTNALASIRKKDDKLNWFLGGFAAGSVFGMYTRSVVTGIHTGAFFGFCAFMKKYAHENGWTFFETEGPIAHMTIWDPDWTLTKERKRNWVKSASEIGSQ